MNTATQTRTPDFEIEVGELGELFTLLHARELEHAAAHRTLAQRAIYVSASQHRTYTGYGLPERVRRYVCASFRDGQERVCYRVDTSYRLETYTSPDSLKQDAGQKRELEAMKAELEAGLRERGLAHVPILLGSLRRCSWWARR